MNVHVGGFFGVVLLMLLVVTVLQSCDPASASPRPPTLRPVWDGVTGAPDWWTPELTRTPFPTAMLTRTPTAWPSPTGHAPTPRAAPSRTPGAQKASRVYLPLVYR